MRDVCDRGIVTILKKNVVRSYEEISIKDAKKNVPETDSDHPTNKYENINESEVYQDNDNWKGVVFAHLCGKETQGQIEKLEPFTMIQYQSRSTNDHCHQYGDDIKHRRRILPFEVRRV
ncbi:hypothetical protein EVAR_24647_1 [Eumeta japonica]|uniref:Uncharacterized protein n=1 Tax=Eumeta variegata TaxID=151549 RepID=A0A4C1V143_EUMVA|nr:hypothetical protein EVAR_24647_1 [Eumeta japonica]